MHTSETLKRCIVLYVEFVKWSLMFSFIHAYDVGLSASVSLNTRLVKQKINWARLNAVEDDEDCLLPYCDGLCSSFVTTCYKKVLSPAASYCLFPSTNGLRFILQSVIELNMMIFTHIDARCRFWCLCSFLFTTVSNFLSEMKHIPHYVVSFIRTLSLWMNFSLRDRSVRNTNASSVLTCMFRQQHIDSWSVLEVKSTAYKAQKYNRSWMKMIIIVQQRRCFAHAFPYERLLCAFKASKHSSKKQSSVSGKLSLHIMTHNDAGWRDIVPPRGCSLFRRKTSRRDDLAACCELLCDIFY